jgi:phospholipid transport system substrate-binding protein
MSIVGPRPHAVAHNEAYRKSIKGYMVRHKVRPGISGLAQVNGLRSEIRSLEMIQKRVEYDLEYLRHWWLGLDLRIIFRAVLLVLRGDRHAYWTTVGAAWPVAGRRRRYGVCSTTIAVRSPLVSPQAQAVIGTVAGAPPTTVQPDTPLPHSSLDTMHQTLRLFLCATGALIAQTATAQHAAPDALVRSVTSEVIEIVRQDKDIQSGNRAKAIALVEQKVLPHFDFTRMTALAMGANWRQATPEQQARLVDEFRTLLVRTYSTALSAYRNQAIDVKPPRARPDAVEVMVRSEVKQSGSEALTIDYSMAKTPAGWKVFDVAVAGASLVTTYRDSFAAEARAGGIDGVIRSIAAKNQRSTSS